MTIREVEEKTGLTRSNIRFYEREGLLAPARNTANGYRDYSEDDVKVIQRIAFLRTLGISVSDIRKIREGKLSLRSKVEEQRGKLQKEMQDLEKTELLCEKLLLSSSLDFDSLNPEIFMEDPEHYRQEHRQVWEKDSAGFLSLWGSFAVWGTLTLLCLAVGAFFYSRLPDKIPVQWNAGEISAQADKIFIFAYPAVCILIRLLLRPVLYTKLQSCTQPYGRLGAEFLTNFFCFVALSVEVFTILYIYGLARSIVMVFAVDAVILLGLLAFGLFKRSRRPSC